MFRLMISKNQIDFLISLSLASYPTYYFYSNTCWLYLASLYHFLIYKFKIYSECEFCILIWCTTLTKFILLIMYFLKLIGLRSTDCLLLCFFYLPLNTLYFILPYLFVNFYVLSFPFSPYCFSLTVAVFSIATELQRTFRKK